MNQNHSSASTPVATPTDLTILLEPVKDELEAVERFLNSNLIDDSPFVTELLAQVFKSGGKRLRPALVFLAAKATLIDKNQTDERQVILAALTEFIHSASLVHDDVIDNSSFRRGQETVNRKWNEKLAVLAGDLLFAQASICLSRLMNPRIVGIYGQVLGDLCAGEIRQMRQQFSLSAGWDNYIQKSIWKTASLFAAGTQSAAILNQRSESEIEDLKSYGVNFGICFQIVDDLLDITGSTSSLGKPAGSDLMQGLITAPTMFILERKDAQAERLRHLIETRAVASAEGQEESLSIIRNNGGVESTVELARKYASLAQNCLAQVPASQSRDSLEYLLDWLLTRTN
ncbi:MAG: polyprenyl synthetase family protein [Candidatus Obscuribacterales bacterium]|nr:polyprenyl synthetase family protein [Candidatus Obscuribacterales bacterium]